MKKHKFVIIALVLYLIVHLVTISRSPLPWFDEVFFASLSENLWARGTFHVPVSVLPQEIKLYGFVYFWLTGFTQYIGQASIFSFRIVNFLAGLGVAVWLYYAFSRQSIWVFVFLLDPFFHLCLHEGRMDLLAVLFILLSFSCLRKTTFKYQVLAGLFALLALLTTPRVAFMGVGLGCIWVINFSKSPKMVLQIIVPLLVLCGYFSWIWVGFGGVFSFLKHYTHATSGHFDISPWAWYVGGTGYVPRHEYLLLVCLVGSALWYYVRFFYARLVLKKVGKVQFHILIYIVFVACFHLFVRDMGQYSIFILPFYYVLLVHYTNSFQRLWQKTVVSILLLFNLTYFTLKNTQVFLSWDMRNPQLAAQFIKTHIPKGSKVVGEAMYYYAVRANGCAYQMFEVYEDLPAREKIQREKFGYQYIIITAHSAWRHKEVTDYYLNRHPKIRKVATLQVPLSRTALWLSRIARLSTTENTGYSATIYAIQ